MSRMREWVGECDKGSYSHCCFSSLSPWRGGKRSLTSSFWMPSSSHVVFLLLVVKYNTIAMPNCFFPLTSQPKARVSMLGSTLEAESMMLRGSLHALDRS